MDAQLLETFKFLRLSCPILYWASSEPEGSALNWPGIHHLRYSQQLPAST
jgi:hypothetical protein